MEWIRRNPKSAVALSALAVLSVVLVVWAMAGSSAPEDEPSTLGTPSPSATASRAPLSVLPSPTGGGATLEEALAGFGSTAAGGPLGNGAALNLDRHRIVIAAGSDGPLLGVGWKIPLAEGQRQGKDVSGKNRTFRHSTHTYGDRGYAFLGAYTGSESSHVWCTISIDGKVIERQEANSPYGQVYCYA